MTMQEYEKEFWSIAKDAAQHAAREAIAGKPFWLWPELTADMPPSERMERAEQIVQQLVDSGLDIKNSEIVGVTLQALVNAMMAGWQAGYESKMRNRRP